MKLSEQMRARIGELVEQRAALQDAQAAILAEVEKRDNKALTDAEQASYDEKREPKRALDTEIAECETRYAELVEDEARDARAAESRAKYGNPTATVASTVVNEPEIYQRGNRNGPSYFRDLGNATSRGDHQALKRLRDHSEYERRAIGNTNGVGGSGGEWAPPTWLVNDWLNLIRPGRVTADLFSKEVVPTGTSSVNYPRLISGTSTAIQSTQNTALAQTDITTGFVSTGFATIGGKQVISQQLLDQSAIDFDTVIMKDLAASYAQQVGTQVFTGTGTGTGITSVINGLSNATAGSTQTWTQASPTVPLFYSQAGNLLSKFVTARLMPPTCWVMSPRRWYWLASASDNSGRPYVIPGAGNAYNPVATEPNGPQATGPVGTMHGVPVVIDPLVPTNLGTGNNQDLVYLLKTDDLVLFESQPQPEAFRETYADSVGVLFRLYCYVATILNRHPESIGVMGGTGLVTPTFAG